MSNDKKQTAVDWYFDKIKSHFEHDGDLYEVACMTYELAKEREKEQIQDAFQDGKRDWADHITEGKPSKDLAQYYREVYGKEDIEQQQKKDSTTTYIVTGSILAWWRD